MPTTRPRHQVTETDEVARALDLAAQRWPGEPRSRLLLRLVQAGGEVIDDALDREEHARRRAIRRTSGKYADIFTPDYLVELRADWPE